MTEQAAALLRRVFAEGRAGYMVITSRREEERIRAASLGQAAGWLECDMVHPDHQSSAMLCWLTPAGRAHFGLTVEGGEKPEGRVI